MKIYQNFKEIKGEGTKLNPLSASYQWGIGCFTTSRTINGKIFEIENHLERLESNLKEIQNCGFLKEIILEKQKIVEFLRRESKKAKQEDHKIKIMLTEDGVFIIIDKLKIEEEKIEKGIKCKTVNLIRNFPQIKSCSWQEQILTKSIIKKDGYDEGVFCNQENQLTEATSGNLFWIQNNQIYYTNKKLTLSGVTQELALKILKNRVKIGKLNISEINKIESAFITKSLDLIVPIKEINGIKLNTNHPIIEELKNKFKNY